MITGIAIWNYCWKAGEVPGWIHYFADHGFEAISFHPDQFAGESARYLPPVVAVLRNRNLRATVHGSACMDSKLMESMVHAMGDRLDVFSLDSVMRQDSRGALHDAKRIKAALTHLQKLTQGTRVLLAIEDFPLDSAALDFFAPDLGSVYEHERTGILIDVGHMHMRMTSEEYFRGMSIADYFSHLPFPLVEVHLHDNNGKRDQHAHFGFGSVPFPDIAGVLRSREFDGVCTIEIAPTLHGSTPQDSKKDAIQSLEHWQRLSTMKECEQVDTPLQSERMRSD